MIDASRTEQAYNMVSSHPFARVLLNPATGQKSLHATVTFAPGDVISQFHAGSILPEPSYLTVQIGENRHITLLPEFLQYINHSCAPTVFFDTTTLELVCLKHMKPGDELTFFYPSTEWEMAQPFACHCGSPECIEMISGAAALSTDVLSRYRLTDFIRGKVKNRE